MFPLAVGVAVVGLGALGTLGQLVAALAALETLEDRDPQRLVLIDVFLRFGILADVLLRGGSTDLLHMFGRSWLGGDVDGAAIARGTYRRQS